MLTGLAEWTPNAFIRLAKNPHFHSAAEVATDTVEYFPIEQPASELSRYRAGELHITETIPAGRHDWLKENYPRDLRIHPYLGSFWLYINLRHPLLGSSADLRRALALAIDRDILTRVVIAQASNRPSAWYHRVWLAMSRRSCPKQVSARRARANGQAALHGFRCRPGGYSAPAASL